MELYIFALPGPGTHERTVLHIKLPREEKEAAPEDRPLVRTMLLPLNFSLSSVVLFLNRFGDFGNLLS